MLRDTDFGVARVRAFGTFDFKIVDVKTFLKEVAGTDIISGSTNFRTRCAPGW